MTKKDRVINILKEHGELTTAEIADHLGSRFRSSHCRSADYRLTIYRLLYSGVIERVPNVKPIRWRLSREG
jgi:hypothetical protein